MPLKTPRFWYETTPLGIGLQALLSPIAWVYQCLSRLHAAQKTPQKLSIPVICVGNLTAGGAGKTPTVIAIINHIKSTYPAARPAILLRGYGANTAHEHAVNPATDTAENVGDEALILAQYAPTIIARDRAKGAALSLSMRADIIVMDDGLYNYDLVHDLDLVVVDRRLQFGNVRTLPAGPLREPLDKGLARADAFIVIGDDSAPMPALPRDKHILTAHIEPRADLALPEEPVIAFCGIATPQKFFDFLEHDIGAKVQRTVSFADHHTFTPRELANLKASGAPLITTEKDYVRIPPAAREGITPVPIDLVFDAPDSLSELIKPLMSAKD